ncbi:MAG: hypothetical protein ABL882_05520 [Sphingopyxis sp.]
MELLTILYALLAATIGFGGGERAAVPVGQAISAEARVAAVEVAVPCQHIVVPSRALVAVRPSLVRAHRAARVLLGVAPQRLFAITHLGRRLE